MEIKPTNYGFILVETEPLSMLKTSRMGSLHKGEGEVKVKRKYAEEGVYRIYASINGDITIEKITVKGWEITIKKIFTIDKKGKETYY